MPSQRGTGVVSSALFSFSCVRLSVSVSLLLLLYMARYQKAAGLNFRDTLETKEEEKRK